MVLLFRCVSAVFLRSFPSLPSGSFSLHRLPGYRFVAPRAETESELASGKELGSSAAGLSSGGSTCFQVGRRLADLCATGIRLRAFHAAPGSPGLPLSPWCLHLFLCLVLPHPRGLLEPCHSLLCQSNPPTTAATSSPSVPPLLLPA